MSKKWSRPATNVIKNGVLSNKTAATVRNKKSLRFGMYVALYSQGTNHESTSVSGNKLLDPWPPRHSCRAIRAGFFGYDTLLIGDGPHAPMHFCHVYRHDLIPSGLRGKREFNPHYL
jgi:hypothetical protein